MVKSAKSSNSFFRELKRRKVVRTCVLYLILCWIVLQVADMLFPAMGLDAETASRNAVYIAVLGFPLTVAIAWFFQISAGGVVMTTAFEEHRLLDNISPINERRQDGMSKYFRKDETMPEYSWVLSAESGPLEGLSFGVCEPLIVGRALGCDVTMVSQHLSRQHARLDLEGDQLTVEDLGSANGTALNGKKIEGVCDLQHDDELRFHEIVFRVTRNYPDSRRELDAMGETTLYDGRNS